MGVKMADRNAGFEPYRQKLFGVAYRMLGSRADAEDVVQDAYLRWHCAAPGDIRSTEAWLVTVATRLSIDRLRHAQAERHAYVGPWLPEPLVRTEAAADAPTELASSLSVAFLVVLERLAPEERAAFLLHEVFDSGYDEIARILGKSEAACRQIVSRARKRVRADRPRVQVSKAASERLLSRFAQAIQAQDKVALLELLAKDATWISDGGGRAKAALKPMRGGDRVARFLMGVLGRHAERLRFEPVMVNKEPGLSLSHEDRLIAVISFQTDGAHILAAYSVLNPEKLRAVDRAVS
jgi:RNA polymerase sigma-70 factor (ECF subfamily)